MNKLIECLDRQFAQLHSSSRESIPTVSPDLLYRKPPSGSGFPYSFGEHILRSAATVEQTFGGITANLWDDPFEWTLPENLSTPERVIEDLDEVDATRTRAFDGLARETDLAKDVLVPAGITRPLIDLLDEALVEAVDWQGRAIPTLRILSDIRVPGLDG